MLVSGGGGGAGGGGVEDLGFQSMFPGVPRAEFEVTIKDEGDNSLKLSEDDSSSESESFSQSYHQPGIYPPLFYI